MEFMTLAAEKFSFPMPVYFIAGGVASLIHHNLRGVAIADSVQGVIERTLLCVFVAVVLIYIEHCL